MNKYESPQALREHKIHFYRQIAFTFIGAALVVMIGLIYFSLSQAVIKITPALEQVMADFNVLLDSESNQTERGIDARLIMTEVVVERTGTGEFLAEGDPAQASGTVTLTNTSSNSQALVATTRLLSEGGTLFRLRNAVTVPANGEIEAEVFADQPGVEGEIAPTRFTIPGLNQARQQEVYAESDSAMTGGSTAIYRVTQAAVDAAVDEAKLRITEQARATLQTEGIDVSTLLASTSWVEIKDQTVQPEVGADAQQFTISLSATVAFVQATEEDLLALAQEELYSTTSLGYELSSSDEGSFSYTLLNFDEDKGSAQIRITLRGQRRISASHPILDASNFVGKKPSEVKALLEADPGIESVDVELRPFWVRKVPRLVDHVYVQFAS